MVTWLRRAVIGLEELLEAMKLDGFHQDYVEDDSQYCIGLSTTIRGFFSGKCSMTIMLCYSYYNCRCFFSRKWGSLEWPPPKWQWGSDIITTWVLLHVTTCGKTNYIPNLSSLIGAINIYKPPNDPIWGRVLMVFCIQFTSLHHNFIEPRSHPIPEPRNKVMSWLWIQRPPWLEHLWIFGGYSLGTTSG